MNEKKTKENDKSGTVATFIFLVIVGIFVYNTWFKNDDSSSKSNEDTGNGNKNYVIEVDALTLSNVYYNNELDGNKKYFGKRIKTSGKFVSADKGFFTGWNASFNTEGIYNYYCSSFASGEEKYFSQYNRGEPLIIYGQVDELVGNSIRLNECDLERY